MTSDAELLFLGTGASLGVPLLGCKCAICRSNNPHNKRTRCSSLLTVQGKKFLIDCGPDFHTQALKYGVDHIDGLILTHTHNDHTAGLDETRAFRFIMGKSVPCLLSLESADAIKSRFPFLIYANPKIPDSVAAIKLQVLSTERGEVEFEGVQIKHFAYSQSGMRVDGYRFGNFAYVTDIHTYPHTIFDDLEGVEILVVSALRFTHSYVHLSIDEAIDFARRIKAKQTYFIHMTHELDHESTNAYLPPDIRLAYDGLRLFWKME